jgi:UDPglucose--hexose-1-phosphate uridylyltransferase
MPDLDDRPHRRFNPLLDEWVLVSPQRLARPWLGQVEPPAPASILAYDPDCYLCPGNARAGNARNPRYEGTFVFDNDFPALTVGPRIESATPADPLLLAVPEHGICRVVCYSPRHDAALPSLSVPDLRRVVDVWIEQLGDLAARPHMTYVQIFENRGAAMGASNPHPHGQIWASSSLPDVPAREQASFERFRSARSSCLLCDYLARERTVSDRVVVANDHFTALVPFWSVWPFETMVVPHRHVTALDDLAEDERTALADILKTVTMRYDALFSAPCPYSMGFHQRPVNTTHPDWHLHAHFFPPVLRSASVHKFMVGYELLATPQRDLTPERAAAMLRTVHEATS